MKKKVNEGAPLHRGVQDPRLLSLHLDEGAFHKVVIVEFSLHSVVDGSHFLAA